ncbi:glycosyltransferase [Archangium violaceum]|uniref:rhamnosyltransferase WsaF family glycosyltransferase n=1 Tax=Archangium violaceum TaxID=83451 RepID=UPI00193B4B79|nr:glycosyltransferase [Archangium violaceum]QRK05458.1 glycosyltransferase [Archangium violaceum]
MIGQKGTLAVNVTTVDVWDTLLRRRCHPDETKLAAARYVLLKYGSTLLPGYRTQRAIHERRRASEVEIGDQRKREGLDDEYELREVWALTLGTIAPHVSEAQHAAMVKDVCAQEWAAEFNVSYPDARIGRLLSRVASGHELYFLSDFYVPSAQLHELIAAKHPELALHGGMSSCSERVNKRSGRLFTRFQEKSGVTPPRHQHIGDNEQSDVAVPRSHGIKAVHFFNPDEERKRQRLAHQFQRRMAGDLTPYWRALKERLRTHHKAGALTRADRHFNLGVKYSPVLVLYVVFALERALAEGVKRVYYFTREGEILKEIHERILASNPGLELPAAEVLEVSRIATFGASIQQLNLTELNRLWTMYPRHSLRTFLTSLGVQVEAVAELVKESGVSLEEVIERPWEDARFRGLLANERFCNTLLQALKGRRDLLLRYLEQKGITPESKRVLVVDIGWRGTIQDNLARVLPQVHWSGLFLSLFRFLNPQPANCTKTGFLFDDNRGDHGEHLLAPQAPIEMLFNSENGSVTGYRLVEGRVQAERLTDPGENRVHEQFTRDFHRGVLASAPTVWAFLQERGLLSSDLSRFVTQTLSGLLARPPFPVASAYFQLEHNETFGNGVFVKQNHQLQLDQLVRTRRPRAMLEDLKRQATASGWNAGFYAVNHLTGMQQLRHGAKDVVRGAIHRGRLLADLGRNIWRESRAKGMPSVLEEMRGALQKRGPGKELRPLLEVVGDVDLQDELRLNFNALHRKDRQLDALPLVMSWIIPDIGMGSGGHMSILRFVRYFQSLGVTNRVYVHGRSEHGSPQALRQFMEGHYQPLPGVDIHDTTAHVEESDVLLATHWSTAYAVYERQNTRFKAYFIQDFEPHFYPKGSLGVFAENTYRMNLFGISASPWLHQMMTGRYGMQGCFFHLGYEPGVYFPDPRFERDPHRVLVYMRPSTERRGTELLLAALAHVKEQRPQTRIAIFGTGDLGYRDVPFEATVLGLQNEEQLRQQHSSSAITLLTSLTNYSLLPIEAMACGAVVVDVDVESMRGTFGDDSPVVLAPPDPLGIARTVIGILDDRVRRERLSAEGLAYVKEFSWESSFVHVENAFVEAYFGKRQPAGLPDGSLVRGIGGARVFLVQGGVKYHIPSEAEFKARGLRFEDVLELPVKQLLIMPNGGPIQNADAQPRASDAMEPARRKERSHG